MKKTMLKAATMLMSASLSFGLVSATTAYAYENNSDALLAAAANEILENAYQELGFDADDIAFVTSDSSGRACEIYEFVYASNIDKGVSYRLNLVSGYNSTYLEYEGYFKGGVVDSCTVTNSVSDGSNTDTLSGVFNMNNQNSSAYNQTNVVAFRFAPKTSSTNYSDLVSKVYDRSYLYLSSLTYEQSDNNSTWDACSLSNITSSILIPGDLDGNGVINSDDSTLLSKAVAGVVGLTPNARTSADINCDGLVNQADLSILLQFLNGNIAHFYS